MGPVTEQSEHLSNAQIENYGIRTSGAGPDAAQRDEHQRANHQSIDDQTINDQSISDRQIDDQRVEAHLADCASCRNRLLGLHRSLFTGVADSPEADPSGNAPSQNRISPSSPRSADANLEGSRPTGSALADSKFANPNDPVDPQVRTAPTPECPSTEALRELAAGLTPDDLAVAITRHAATCDHCGPLLRAFTEDFSDDFSPEEQAVLNNLQSASAEWQKNTAREMLQAAGASAASAASSVEVGSSGTTAADQPDKKFSTERPASTGPNRKPFFWKWALVPAVAAALAAITFPIYYAQRNTPEKVEVLLAQASTEQRNVRMRVPYAKYSEFHQRRSGEPIPYAKLPKSFRKASDAISNHLEANPDDPEWLLLSARLDLLNRQYKPALLTLEKIENKDPARQPEIDMVRALALYEKAEDDADPQEYGPVIELLEGVLKQSPNDPVALHNQAVAYEKAQMYERAIEYWNRLLEVEKDPGWAGEARQHLAQIQEKKNPALVPSPK